MRMAELSRTTGVPVATLKYYLREGLLQPGNATSRTQAQYDDTHVQRVRLIRALTGMAGMSLGAVGEVLTALDSPHTDRLNLMAVSQRASFPGKPVSDQPSIPADGQPSRAAAWAVSHGWQCEGNPWLERLDAAWRACEDAGLQLSEEHLSGYAAGMEQVARADVHSVSEEPQAAVRQVVLGTLLTYPALVSLRRLAQSHVATTQLSTTQPPQP